MVRVASLLAVLCAAWLGLAACDEGEPGLGIGETCNPNLNSRDCEEGLVCTLNYDQCPTYGCPTCRRPCRADTDCPQAESGCDRQPVCVFQSRAFERGVCELCPDGDPYN